MMEMDGLRKVVYDGMYICGGGERERERENEWVREWDE